jgi:uncharacterized protein
MPRKANKLIDSPAGPVRMSILNWKQMRDTQVVKQDLDFSCGAASLATLLYYYFGQDLSEATLIQAMDKGDGMASFDDMARAMPKFGFQAHGLASSWDQLTKLNVPVIVHIKQHKRDHFVVLRGISQYAVWLADPSRGNRTLSRSRFLDLWRTRSESNVGGLDGRLLVIQPVDPVMHRTAHFFRKWPPVIGAAGVHPLGLISAR